MPQQRAAVDDAVHPLLESRARQRLQQRARQRQMDPGDVLVPPQRARDPVHRPEDLLGLPFLVVASNCSRLPLGWCRLSARAKPMPAKEPSVLQKSLLTISAVRRASSAAVVGPDALTPVPVAAGLRRQQVVQRVAVAPLGGGDTVRRGPAPGTGRSPGPSGSARRRTRAPRRCRSSSCRPPCGSGRPPPCSAATTSASRSGPSPGTCAAQIRCWKSGCSTGRSPCWTPVRPQLVEVLGLTFIIGVPSPSTRRTTSWYLDGNSFIITPPFSPSAIWTTSGGTLALPSCSRPRPFAS